MAQTLASNKVTFLELEQQFGLVSTRDRLFFTEWLEATGEVTLDERQDLDRVRSNFENLLKSPPLLEEAVKMVVLSPLLDLAGFYQAPFRVRTEVATEISSMDESGLIVKGEIDVLVVLERLWVLVIESKMSNFSLTSALPQILSYMLSSNTNPGFGMVTNGSDFVFLKLGRRPTPTYATSKVFSLLAPENELVAVLQILRHLGQLVVYRQS